MWSQVFRAIDTGPLLYKAGPEDESPWVSAQRWIYWVAFLWLWVGNLTFFDCFELLAVWVQNKSQGSFKNLQTCTSLWSALRQYCNSFSSNIAK